VLDLIVVMSSYLGKTGNNLRSALDHAKANEAILLLDEIDAIAKRRSDESDVGELKRLVTVMLQEVDDWPDTDLLLAATNHPELVDPALWRRFDAELHAWSAVIDEALDDGNTLMTVAAGNNGENDAQLGLNRIQVPSDCVNAVTVGASDSSTIDWARASYSAVGPGRSPGRRKPDVLAFGGSHKEYFHVAEPGMVATAVPQRGTSFAAPLVLRMGVGVRAILGPEVNPLTIKALLVHSAERGGEPPDHVGWGRVPSDVNALITTEDGEARIMHAEERFQGRSLKKPVIDIHYNAREGCGNANSADCIPYALVVTVKAGKHPMLHDEILAAHSKLKALAPRIHVQLGGK
jgi:hypothetical protein